MSLDWLTRIRRSAPSDNAPDPVRSLATGVLQLCTLCEELTGLVALHDPALPAVHAIPERIDAVRTCAGQIKHQEAARASDRSSLAALGLWVSRE